VLARCLGGGSASVFQRYHSEIAHLQQALQAPTDDDLQCFMSRCHSPSFSLMACVTNGCAGPSLLLIHGFGVGTYTFNRNMHALSKAHRVFACDLLGQGGSWPCKPPRKEDALEYSIDTWAEQLASFIRDVIADDRGVYLAGNSLGGLLATTVAYRYPEVRPALPLKPVPSVCTCGL
jgi:pimeloyl-ACP methyl ester carboxylesterase